MEIVIKRIYMRETCTVGCLQVILSGEYESESIDSAAMKPYPKGGLWTTLCNTLEPHAIPWEDKPLIGQQRGERIPGKTAIPEGTYRVCLAYSKTYKRKMPMLMDVPEFKSIVMRTGKSADKTRGDILVGKASTRSSPDERETWELNDSRKTFNQLYALIDEALDYGEDVRVVVRSRKGWTT